MSDLPSRVHFTDLIPGDYRTSEASEYRVLQAYAEGRLVDRETFDYEAMLLEYDPEFTARRAGMFDDDWALLRSKLERAAIGGSDEK